GRELFSQGLAPPAGAAGLPAALTLNDEARLRLASGTPPAAARWLAPVARDLLKHRGRSLIVVGERQPAAVHALTLALNAALGNLDHTVALVPDPVAALEAEPLASLAAALGGGAIDTLLVLGGNPVYEAPADLSFAAALGKARVTIHVGGRADETGARCTWHLPVSHPLESWGDLRATDGTVAIVQPLIAPLFDTRSEIEVLARLLGRKDARGYDLVRATWQQQHPGPDFDRRWNVWLADGVVGDSAAPPTALRLDGAAVARAVATAPAAAALGPGDLELDFHVDRSLLDGRYANNAWLQEWPDPVTKLVWDNAALVGPQTAKALGVKTGAVLALGYRGRALQAPVFVQPGQAEHTVSLALGYGRAAAGRHGDGKGVNANALRDSTAPWFDRGLTASPVLATYQLATTQRHGEMEGRPVLREATHAQYQATPDFAARQAPPHPPLKSLWKKPNPEGGHQWGMAIDLTTCTGCSACVLACQAENNIPVVGKDQVLRYREMHWLRIDRYYKGSAEAPEASVQPIPCMQCETAPCESVCPVVASVHSPEGLNDQVYNRCIGTRYCSNNCPYKVRHFNFYNFNENLTLLDQMYKNPEVTVRGRGVMEKCTYCIQRINAGKIAAKRAGTDEIRDGAITPACAQTCPADAIVFGDLNDPKSRVAQLKAGNRNYALLEELNTQPRTTYLAKLRNPNPELA
ncbi:MAG TPA: hypothetical protein VGQ83_33945, partial [Polyangia bacterium]